MLLQKIFFTMKDKYSISIDEIDDLFEFDLQRQLIDSPIQFRLSIKLSRNLQFVEQI